MFAFDILKNLFKKPEPQEDLQIEVKSENKVPVIDVSKPADLAKQELLNQCEKFMNYNEILQIDDVDRKALLNDIYNSYGIHGIPKFFREKYSKYNENLIEQIFIRESNRFNIRMKAYHYKNMTESSINKSPFWFDFLGWQSVLTGKGANFSNASCTFEDLLNLNLTNDLECFFENGRYAGFNIITNYQGVIKKENQNPIKFYHNGKLHIMDKKEFKNYRKEHNLMLYLNSTEATQNMWKEVLRQNGIPFDENKPITQKFFFEALKKYKESTK